MGPEQLIKTATGQRRRRLRDEARSRRQWRPVLRSGGLLALGGCSRGQSSAVASISVTTAAIAGFVQLRRV